MGASALPGTITGGGSDCWPSSWPDVGPMAATRSEISTPTRSAICAPEDIPATKIIFGFTLYCVVKFRMSCRRKPASSGHDVAGGEVQVPLSDEVNAASIKYAFQFHWPELALYVDAGCTSINSYWSATLCQPQLRVLGLAGGTSNRVPCSMRSIGGFAGRTAGRKT